MTRINPAVTNQAVIPTLESRVFDGAPDSGYAVGIIAVGKCVDVNLGREYAAHFDLRRAVYVDQTAQLLPEDIGEDGTDRDRDDDRSVVFGVLENAGSDAAGKNQARLVATARLIIKGLNTPNWRDAMQDPLPVEQEWREQFRRPAPAAAVEVSRLISRHESARVQDMNKVYLYMAMLTFVQQHDLGPAYAIVEEWFERNIGRMVPNRRIGKPKYVEHYNDTNVALEIDIPAFGKKMHEAFSDTMDSMPRRLGQFAYFGARRSLYRGPAAQDRGIA